MTRGLRTICVRAGILLSAFAISIPAAADSEKLRPEPESYMLHCSGCHRADGRGVPGVAPDLREIGPLLRTEAGRAYLGRVPGVAQAPVNDEELARLLNWVLSEIAGTPPQPAYTAREVGILRAEPLRDPIAARSALPAPES
jgi:mono/diheme cytochrome c family protein